MNESPQGTDEKEIRQIGGILLKTGTLLMGAGANTGRVRTTVNRLASALGLSVGLHISQRSITLEILDNDGVSQVSMQQPILAHAVNFRTISGISRMSWRVVEEQWTIIQIQEELNRLGQLSRLPRWLVLTMVGLAGAGFCALADGSPIELAFTFIASFIGLFVKQEAIKASFNSYVSVYFAAFIASFIAGAGTKLGITNIQNHAFVTSVLFLVPGVPFINSVSDIMDENIQNGIARGFSGLLSSLSIAFGILTSALIYQF